VAEVMTLAGARVALNSRESDALELHIHRGRISALGRPGATPAAHSEEAFDLESFLILPGLINTHDHLEFNLFPRIGRGIYPNATAWSNDIYRPDECPIRQHLDVPKPLRLVWGGIKNLVNGVTSVSHHNPYQADVFDRRFPVRVVKRFGWAHSIGFCPDPGKQFRQTPPRVPFIIHAAEGTDKASHSELKALDDAGVLAANTVIVHGVAIAPGDLPLLKRRGVSLVWCPTSNLFMLGKTLRREVLESDLPIALGTDSALTAAGDLASEIHVANRYVSAGRIYEMLTGQAARVLRLRQGQGTIRKGGLADLLIVRDRGQTPGEALIDLHPELVLVSGMVKLISLPLAARLKFNDARNMHRIEVAGRGEWLIDCDVPALDAAVSWVLGKAFRLAGRKVSS
jgi:cytosine/adenosine deaminase-related metal-dependent hydrolase